MNNKLIQNNHKQIESQVCKKKKKSSSLSCLMLAAINRKKRSNLVAKLINFRFLKIIIHFDVQQYNKKVDFRDIQ